ncbi:SPOR domain-containing protein [Tropicimonas sp. TH_r6]|uniref:SPOR domain-containing protein n=1 Tax=Tropicimonas sp. TH_r6 TaxID=3082085 RepID=UPI0029541F25|nr:SPOR domain-containing protein [Tropicimonas sp. TH_r6]MDV7144425.1 SPOR domain-containing protein [Tropicimonas sp. TH_r6]
MTQGHTHPEFELHGIPGEEDAYRAGGAGGFRIAAHALGALLSLAVIGFGGYWGYKQIMRDVNGVPVVRALDGPIRIAPENPGGQVADHAGLAVNDVQAVGTASEPEARLTLAPAPVELAEEDLPVAQLDPVVETVLGNAAEAADAEILPPEAKPEMASLSQELPEEDPVALALKLAETATAGARPLGETELSDPVAEAGTEMASASTKPLEEVAQDASGETESVVTGPGVKISPRPAPRPSRRTASVPSATPVSATSAAVEAALAEAMGTSASTGTSARPAVLEASAVPTGTRMVQLGAFDSDAEARAAWDKISGRFDGLMADKTQVVLEAKAGGRSFWRLRAMGFEDLSDARRFCAALVAERADCIPVISK